MRRYGLPDSVFQRGDRPMTAAQIVRLTASNLLDIPTAAVRTSARAQDHCLEVKAAHPDLGDAVEKEPSGIELLKENVQRLSLRNIHGLRRCGQSVVMDDLPVCQRCFIGGSGGEMKIFETLRQF